MSKLELEKRIYRAAGQPGELTHTEFRVLVVLMTYTDQHGRNAHPAGVRLAEATGISKANITRHLKALEAKGYIVKTEQGGNAHGMRRANVYRVEFPARLIHKGVTTTTGDESEEGVNLTPGSDLSFKGVTTTTKGVTTTTEGCHGDTPSGPLSDHPSDPSSFTSVARAAQSAPHAKTPEASSPNPLIRNRVEVLDMIQAIAADPDQYSMDDLYGLLEEHHSQELADYLEYGWDVPRKATDRYEAGAWLNKLLHTAAREGITITPVVTTAPEPRKSFLPDDDPFDDPFDEEAERNRQMAALRARFPETAA